MKIDETLLIVMIILSSTLMGMAISCALLVTDYRIDLKDNHIIIYEGTDFGCKGIIIDFDSLEEYIINDNI